MEILTVIIGYRDRELIRVKRCLDSFANQTRKDFSVIFVNYGSSPDITTEVEKLLASYPFCKYVYSETRGLPWNRSHAINTGVLLAKGEHVLITDVDMIFSANFISSVSPLLAEDTELHSQWFLLPPHFNDWDSLAKKPTDFQLINKNGLGGVMMIARDAILDLGGFDEYYRVWGLEDRDINSRLKQAGIKTSWADPTIAPVYHQFHPPQTPHELKSFPNGWYEEMSIYFQENIQLLKRNENGFGKILSRNDRPGLKAVDENSYNSRLELKRNKHFFSKPRLIVDLIGEMQKLQSGESLLVEFQFQDEHVRLTKFQRLLFTGIQYLLNKLKMPFIVEMKSKITTAKTFVPEDDILAIVWQLIIRDRWVKDFHLQYEKDFIKCVLIKK